MEARVSEQPAVNERRLMRGVVIQDKMHVEARWHFGINTIQKLAKLDRAMAASRALTGGVFMLLVGAALFWSGNNRQDKTLKRLGLAVLLVGIVLGVLSYFVDTDKERAVRRTSSDGLD